MIRDTKILVRTIVMMYYGPTLLCDKKFKIKRYFKSYFQDIKVLESYFNYGISAIFENPLNFKKLLKNNQITLKVEITLKEKNTKKNARRRNKT